MTEVSRVRVAVVPLMDTAPIYLGAERGIFASRGIELDFAVIDSGLTLIPDVAAGRYDIGFTNIPLLYRARASGLDLKIVASGSASTGIAGADFSAVVVDADSSIRSAKDLVRRSVAVHGVDNLGTCTIRAAVRNAGADPDAVRFVEMPPPDSLPALVSGTVDAAWLVEPMLSIALRRSDIRAAVWNFVETEPALAIGAYFTAQSFRANNADLIRRFTEAMIESLDYATEHPDEARQVITRHNARLTPELAAAQTVPLWPTAFVPSTLDTLARLATMDGLVADRPIVADLFD